MREQGVAELAPLIGTAAACAAAGRSRATHYRRHRISARPTRRAPILHVDRVQPAALSPAERARVLEVLHSDRFADAAPAQVWATLLDEGVYLASESTFYRLLRSVHGDVRERRAQATHTGAGQARTHCYQTQSGLVVGYNKAAWPSEVDVLLPLRRDGRVFAQDRRLDGRHP